MDLEYYNNIKNLQGQLRPDVDKSGKRPDYFGYIKIQNKTYSLGAWDKDGVMTLRARVFDEKYLK